MLEAQRAFRLIDTNKNGFIEADELGQAPPTPTPTYQTAGRAPARSSSHMA